MDKQELWKFKEFEKYLKPEPIKSGKYLGPEPRGEPSLHKPVLREQENHNVDREKEQRDLREIVSLGMLNLKGLEQKATITVPVSPNARNFTRYVVPGLGEYDTEDEAIKAVSANVVAVANKEKRSVSLGEYAVYEITGNVRKVL